MKNEFDAILIDDDELVHMTWKMSAVSNKKRFIGFKSPDDFFSRVLDFNISTPVYIDSNLKNGIKGEDIAKRLYEEFGFRNIYLCTGYDPSSFPSMYWIKAIIGKDPYF